MILGEGKKKDWSSLFDEDVAYLIYSYSLSLVDAIDTLATLGNRTEFARVYQLIQNLDLERDINVSVFESNIRGISSHFLLLSNDYLVIGGLLSAHLLAKRMDIPVNSSWPCEGPLLDLAVALAKKLLPGEINFICSFLFECLFLLAFDTATGKYHSIN